MKEITVRDNLREQNEKKRKSDFLYLELLLVLLLVLSLIFYFNTYVFVFVEVSGPSMQNTLYDGDSLVVNTLVSPDYGDVIVIKDVSSRGWLIKRVVAKGGDKVKIDNGKVFVMYKGKTGFTELKEEYALGHTDTLDASKPIRKTWDVPEGSYFYLGDNRENSSDSRYYGSVEKEKIVGVVAPWSITFKGVRNFFNNIFGR